MQADSIRVYDPFDPAVLADPHPHWQWLRENAPLYFSERRGYWVLTRYDDVFTALRTHQVFSSAKGNAPEPGWQPGLIGTDPPEHARLRGILKGVFTPRRLEENWGARIQQICDELVDAALEAKSVDAYQAFSLPLPIRVIAEMLGVPDGDLVAFKQWSDDMCAGVQQHLDESIKQRTELAFRSLYGFFAAQIAERRAKPRNDLLTMLCDAGDDDRLTDKEVIFFAVLLLIAGNETTTNLIGNGLMALMDHPDQDSLVRANPTLVNPAVEEMLRYCLPTQSIFRQTLSDFSVHGQTIPADSRVMLSLASANRDPRKYQDPDRFWIERPGSEHLAFSSGIHFCLGAALARLETRTLFRTLLERTRSIGAAGEAVMMSTIVVRGPIGLPIELTPS